MRLRIPIAASIILAVSAYSSFFLSLAQTGPAQYEFTVYASYQFNTLRKPAGVKKLENGLYIADTENHVIRKFASTLTTVAGEGVAGYANGAPLSSRFNQPTDVWGKVGHWGCARCPSSGTWTDLWVVDSANFVVRYICLGSKGTTGPCNYVSTVAGSGAQGFTNGPSLSSTFRTMGAAVPLDPTNPTPSQYFVDTENHAIRGWDGSNVTTFAGTGTPGFVNGPRTSAQFFLPGKMTKDGSGNIYVPDMGNHVIRKIDTAGNVTTFAGSPTGEPGYANGTGTASRFSRPASVLFNGACNCIYVADAGNNMIRKVTLSGTVTTYAGAQEGGLVNGSLSQARFTSPMDLDIVGSFMYVADTLNNSIRRIDMSTGVVSTYIN